MKYLEVVSLKIGPFDPTWKINQSGGYNLFAKAAIVSSMWCHYPLKKKPKQKCFGFDCVDIWPH